MQAWNKGKNSYDERNPDPNMSETRRMESDERQATILIAGRQS
jgi:hypothetical protein